MLGLREEVADRDRLAGAGLEHAGADDAEIRVLVVGQVDQCGEGGVVEDVPPVSAGQLAGLDERIIGLDPFGGHRCGRLAVFGPDFEAVLEPLAGPGGDAAAIQQDRDRQVGQGEPSPRTKLCKAVGITPVWNLPGHP